MNKNTKDIKEFTKTADILVVAAGHPNLINSSHIKDGCVVIDVGINKLECGNIVGDVNINDVACKVKAITPVPGGIGPMTISMVIQNTLELYKKKGESLFLFIYHLFFLLVLCDTKLTIYLFYYVLLYRHFPFFLLFFCLSFPRVFSNMLSYLFSASTISIL